ncbi:hypothetical protein [Streptomyces sp. NPDC005181]
MLRAQGSWLLAPGSWLLAATFGVLLPPLNYPLLATVVALYA